MVIIRGYIQLSEESVTLGSEETGSDRRLGSSNDPPDRCKDRDEPQARMKIAGTEKYLEDKLQPPH